MSKSRLRPYLLEAITIIIAETTMFIKLGFGAYVIYTLFLFLFFTKQLWSLREEPTLQYDAYQYYIAWATNPIIFMINAIIIFTQRKKYRYLKNKWLQISLVKTYKSLCNIK